MTDSDARAQRSALPGTLLFAVVAVLLVCVIFITNRQKPPPPPEETDNILPADYQAMMQSVRVLQLQEKWCEAKSKLSELNTTLQADKLVLADFRDEVARNERMLVTLCPGDNPTTSIPDIGVDVDVPQRKSLPEKLPEETLLERYPVGKAIRSVGRFIVNGKGRNTAWGFRGEASFSYLSEIPTETRVLENDAKAGRLVFEQAFGDVVQFRAVSNQTLELVPPDSLVVRTVWPIADQQLKKRSPGYFVFRRVVDAFQVSDPGLKRTLTTASSWLRRAGIPVDAETPDIELAAQVEKISGSRFRVVYVSGLGVTQIARLEGEVFDRDELIRLAHASTVLVDYFVFPTLKRRIGEKWTVRANDVGSVFALYDPVAEIDGTIGLRRGADEATDQIARLEIADGTVTATSTTDGKEQHGRLNVRDGTMSFDMKDLYIRRASIQFSASALHQSRDHLLFGTEQMRDLKVESRYEAELVTP